MESKYRTGEEKYCIVGAGLVGSLLSVMLSKRGFHVDVLERRPDMRNGAADGGRSINLALSDRGLKALGLTGMEKEVRELCIPMHGRKIHAEDGSENFIPYGKEGQYINSISRGGLNELLLNKADEDPNVTLYFDERCENINFDKGDIYLHNTRTASDSKRRYDVIFGTDGAFSAARLGLMKTDMFDFEYKQDYLDHGYKELTIPAAENGGWRIDKNCLHIWPRKSFMMIALPNMDGSFTCTLFLALKGETSFEHLHTDDQVMGFFKRYFPDAIQHMPGLLEDFRDNPTSSLVTIRCFPWNYEGAGLLMGDAAHAIVPFYGQGMNAGFEDCSLLNKLMDEHDMEWGTIFPKFSSIRKPDGDAIADLALYNFIEMRDLVGDPAFLLKNKVDKKLAELYPNDWLTLYGMVTFSHMPYSEAWQKGNEQARILDKIVAEENSIEKLMQPEILKFLAEKHIFSTVKKLSS